jgi:hypothetical protein
MMWFIFMSSAIILFYGGAREAAVHRLANYFAFNGCLVFKATISYPPRLLLLLNESNTTGESG